ncbi:hypothetical protein NQ317_009614 [Molorchus minor]|uniref:Uncharacterized protein n=1 Tax=Molorchus minor TaxID=1323400 RepID=A0ABQ9JJB4_9CUCU|nr:hypothetical protein NQ317_009614 [Molorchus minor]
MFIRKKDKDNTKLGLSKYKTDRLTEAIKDISKKLGPLLKLNLGGTDIIITTAPDHTCALFRKTGAKSN